MVLSAFRCSESRCSDGHPTHGIASGRRASRFRVVLGRANKEGLDVNTNKYFKGNNVAENKGIPVLHPGESLQNVVGLLGVVKSVSRPH